MSDQTTYEGACYCGAVKLTVSGPPTASGICHCRSCRKWHGTALNLWALWPDARVAISEGADQLLEFDLQSEGGPSRRGSCKRCGGAVLNRKPRHGLTVVYAMTLEGSGFVFEPAFHNHYAERIVDIADGLPKYADLPKPLGGSGERVAEPAASGHAPAAKPRGDAA